VLRQGLPVSMRCRAQTMAGIITSIDKFDYRQIRASLREALTCQGKPDGTKRGHPKIQKGPLPRLGDAKGPVPACACERIGNLEHYVNPADSPPAADDTALNDRGVRTARGGAWHDSTVRNLLARAD
jgi:hypothetical protein